MKHIIMKQATLFDIESEIEKEWQLTVGAMSSSGLKNTKLSNYDKR